MIIRVRPRTLKRRLTALTVLVFTTGIVTGWEALQGLLR